MNPFDARLRTWLAWLAPFLVVAALLGWETQWGRGLGHAPAADTPVRAQPVAVALMPEFKLDGAADARRDTVERTLFNPTRRPAPPAPPPAAAAPTMPKGTFALTGTTVVDGKATAFLREVNGGKVRRVQKGETVNGMLVEDVKIDRVRLTLGGDAEEVTLKIASGPRSTVQPAMPTVPGMPGGVPGMPQPVAQGGPQPPVVQDVADVLAQRRRAARAGEVAATQREAQAAAAPAPAPGAAPPAAQAGKADPGWNAVYQRYMQPRQR